MTSRTTILRDEIREELAAAYQLGLAEGERRAQVKAVGGVHLEALLTVNPGA